MEDNESNPSPSERKRFLEEIQTNLFGLPPQERAEAWLHFIATALQVMDRRQILALRSDLLKQSEGSETNEVLEILEGHLALRDLIRET